MFLEGRRREQLRQADERADGGELGRVKKCHRVGGGRPAVQPEAAAWGNAGWGRGGAAIGR